jgi:peptidoglycan hydrolase-like protein with peptidoglycan-binding domain
MELARDLGSADVWADSLERSLARRGRPRRASLELGRLSPERDLSDEDTLYESVVYWRTRRAATASSSFTLPAVGGASVLALLAATTLPSLAGSAKPATGKGAQQRSGAVGGQSTPPAHTVVHRAVSAKPAFAPSRPIAQSHSTPAAPPRPVVYGKVTHGDLRDAQRLLGIPVDDVLGPKTGAAIRAFQQAHGLTADGTVGPATWDALKAAAHARAAAASASAPTANAAALTVHVASAMQPATSTPDPSGVTALQHQLGIDADGNFGTQTAAAVTAYQSAHGLNADGVVGPATRTALGLGDGPTLEAAATSGGVTSPDATTTATTTASDTTSATSTSATSTAATTTATIGPSTLVTAALSQMVAAGDQIATLPYIWGGGHGSFVSPGYDCSGSVSYVLHAAGLLSVPEDSSALESYGAPGPGQYVTIYANAGHAWMTIDGRRYDTVSLSENGSRWGTTAGDPSGFIVRHPVGF